VELHVNFVLKKSNVKIEILLIIEQILVLFIARVHIKTVLITHIYLWPPAYTDDLSRERQLRL